jgi:lysine-specific demethylase 8
MKIPTAPLATLTPAALRAHLARTPTPLILKGLTNSWPKTADWHATDAEGKLTLDALRNVVGEDTAVEVEVGRRGRGYLDPDWQRVTMGFGELSVGVKERENERARERERVVTHLVA